MREEGNQDSLTLPAKQLQHKTLQPSESKRNIKGAIIHMQLNLSELKKQVCGMSQVPQMIHEMQFEFTTSLVGLCEVYESAVREERSNSKRLESALRQLRESTEAEKDRMMGDLERREDLIENLLEKVNILEECLKYKQKDRNHQISDEIKSLKQSNAQLVQVIERYKKHIQLLETKHKSIQYSEKEGFVSLQKRNRFLLDRYLKEKRQNQSLKSHFSSLENEGPKRWKNDSVNNSPATIKNNPPTFRTECSPAAQHHHKSNSRQNHIENKPNRKSIHLYTKHYHATTASKPQSQQKNTPTPTITLTALKPNQRHHKPTNLSTFLSTIRPF